MPKFPVKYLLVIVPLVIIGIAFWLFSGVTTKQLLRRSYGTVDQLEADTRPQVHLKLNLTVVATEIDKEPSFTQVEVKTEASNYKKLEFELSHQALTKEEAIIAQKLGLANSSAKKFNGKKQILIELPVILRVMKAEIDQANNLTEVEVSTTNSILTKFNLEFTSIDIDQVEKMIAQELGLSLAEVKKLIRYRITK
ncbi:hypothetical protein HCG51_27055 [Tolypothrix sp. PCC 7910]|uniref:hypothetical protein n=1 Tax=Tolypothrix sp. PCC 7910 TaxID=2099387 RepID=UPI0014277B2E|nr:hypothetical protein [Tolypothrix sp. PCC 7910]QIR40004.1 hypothetical protein HCG51_27055 [Tolypothrix sp. PCC 7910]